MKQSLTNFLIFNNIINKHHHGGRKHHSTTTALSCLMDQLKTYYNNNLTATTIQTDMSAAFDKMDHTVLLTKLEYYGVRGQELKLMASFLSGRKQFVEIYGIKSTIQGSKLSCILYICYISEVTILHKIIDTCFFLINNP